MTTGERPSMVWIHNGMPADDLAGVWQSSRRRGRIGQGIEYAEVAGQVAVRNANDPHGPALLFSRADIADVVREAKAGRYDDVFSD